MTTRISLFGIGLLAIALLCSAAAGDKIRDNFNDEDRDTSLWRLVEDSIEVREMNGYLESRSRQSGGGERWSGYTAKNWYVDLHRKYTMRGTYHLGQAQGVGGNRYLSGGICLQLDNATGTDIDEIYIGVRYDAGGYWVILETFRDGTLQTFESAPITLQRTELKVKYSAAKDRLDVRINGERKLRLRNFASTQGLGDGQATLGFGASRKGSVRWGWSDYRMDDFFLKGKIIR